MSSAKVKEGALSVEARIGVSDGDEESSQDDRIRTRTHIDYGFTPYYAARLIVSQDKRKSDSYEHDSVKLENRFYLLNKEEHGFDFGFRASYSHKDGDKKPSSAEIKLIEVIPYEGWEFRFNQTVSSDVGESRRPGVKLELRNQVTHKLENGLKLGAELYNDFGRINELSGYDDQSHSFGPVIKGKVLGLSFETGYRAGISKNAIDHSYKLFLKKTF